MPGVKCGFYLLDVNEHEWEGKPGVRLWGIDESGGRVLIQCNLIMPYFYYLPEEEEDVERVKEEVAKELMKEGWKLAVGDKVAYVIVKGPGNLFKKAKPFNQVKSEDVDTEYYLDNQVRPAAMRILERFGVKEGQLFD